MNALSSVQWLVSVLTGLAAYVAVHATMLTIGLISKGQSGCRHSGPSRRRENARPREDQISERSPPCQSTRP
jgi:hypothetical protein